MTIALSPWEHAARAFEPAPAPRWSTPGQLAVELDPRTRQTPALDLIDAALVDAYATPDSRLIISMPPQEGKSVRVARDFPIWALTQNADLRIVTASYAQRLADRNGRHIRNLIAATSHLQLSIADDNGSASEWQLSGYDGGVYSVGIGGALAGRPADLMVIDDPIKDRKEADSEVFRDNVWDWWTDVASARLGPGAPAILITTRWHHDDLAARLIKSDTGWVELNIPAQAEHRPERGEVDVLGREPGEFMISTRGRTREQWEARKRAAGSASWASLYQGNPTPLTGGLFPTTSWRRYTNAPWLERHDGSRWVPGTGEIVQSWDLAFKGADTSDYVVGQVWHRDGARMRLLDQVRGRWTITETVQQIHSLTARWPQAARKLVEDKANGPAVIDLLRHKVLGLVAVNPHGGKETRAQAVTPYVEAGDIELPADHLAPWVQDFVTEAGTFPHGQHDDQVDAFTQAVNDMAIRIDTNSRITTGIVGIG